MFFHIMTLFPEMIDVVCRTSIIGRAVSSGVIQIKTYQIRDFSADEKHHKVDDYTYGGGAGMLMQAQPVYDCYQYVLSCISEKREHNSEIPDTQIQTYSGKIPNTKNREDKNEITCKKSDEDVNKARYSKNSDIIDEITCTKKNNNADEITCTKKRIIADEITDNHRSRRTLYVTPQGRPFTQEMARTYAQCDDLVILCGHYEGVDERVLEEIGAERVSIGDYVLTGGELPAMVIADAVARLVPGVLSNEESAQTESFDDGLLEYPQYTRPEVWRERRVPEILLSGDHAKVDAWRHEQALSRTRDLRPDLYAEYIHRHGD